ncbi:hypothetical protein T4E_1172 [Trichinella pseudospiralis]|uniref:Uncharacterized protein n=1 Tax=Trichinella pseudospiralis TaxID=6337 RepID=A0A0V0WRP2_TRIPS|nr:hypothetical protein T4E_1172 [Trichinella pseudospiralis]
MAAFISYAAHDLTKYSLEWSILVLCHGKENFVLTGFLFLELEVGLMVNGCLHLLRKRDVIHFPVK